jgi:hypothetical protein
MRNAINIFKMLGLAILTVIFSATMFAGLSPVIYNTGVDTGGLLTYPNQDDVFREFTYGLTNPGLTPTGAPAGGAVSTANAVIEDPADFPISTGNWLPNTSTAEWITTRDGDAATGDPNANLAAGGYYVYIETFSMDGFNLVGATLAGNFAADNAATAYLNGHQIGSTGSFSSLTALGNGSGDFRSGFNFLSFIVFNAPNGNSSNPTGLFVDSLAITASPLTTPEPAFYGVLAIGLGGLFAIRNRKKA